MKVASVAVVGCAAAVLGIAAPGAWGATVKAGTYQASGIQGPGTSVKLTVAHGRVTNVSMTVRPNCGDNSLRTYRYNTGDGGRISGPQGFFYAGDDRGGLGGGQTAVIAVTGRSASATALLGWVSVFAPIKTGSRELCTLNLGSEQHPAFTARRG